MTIMVPETLFNSCMNRSSYKTIGALLVSAFIQDPARAGLADKTLDIYWVDVEGGAATLIVTPADESVLIDTGMPGSRDSGRIHQTATRVARLQRIDHLVTTHFHLDHFGGAAELSQLMPIRNVYDNGIPDNDPDQNPDSSVFLKTIKPYREFKAEKRLALHAGGEIELAQPEGRQAPRLRLRCLAARQQLAKPESVKGETKSIMRAGKAERKRHLGQRKQHRAIARIR